jgi:hypothetical protein
MYAVFLAVFLVVVCDLRIRGSRSSSQDLCEAEQRSGDYRYYGSPARVVRFNFRVCASVESVVGNRLGLYRDIVI